MALALLLSGVVLALLISPAAIDYMLRSWESEEYSHSYLIPFIALSLIWQRLATLENRWLYPSWIGPLIILCMAVVSLLGELSSLFVILNYAFVFTLIGLAVTTVGPRVSCSFVGPLAYLIFIVPLPPFLYYSLSQSLQLISSEIGVWVIRLFGISVFLEGNVIDLGVYKLQVVEACSGLRYLFPLASFGFLIAYLFKAPFWQRALVFASTLPITVLMNSFRIGVIGVLVEYWGIGMADGFLHYFEGWIIFIACLGVLFAELWLLNRLFGNADSVWDRIDLSFPSMSEVSLKFQPGWKAIAPMIAAVLVLCITWAVNQSLTTRTEVVPARDSFVQFPLLHKSWIGREQPIEQDILSSLALTDHIMAQYQRATDRFPVNLYIAYYESQRKGSSVHSPKSCIPGGGWEIQSLDQVSVSDQLQQSSASGGGALNTNRVVIQKGGNRQLVYYWFQQRGRHITNEYLVKWYLFVDSLKLQRTDGALVRLVVPVPDGMAMADAEAQLKAFLADFYPLLGRYLPE